MYGVCYRSGIECDAGVVRVGAAGITGGRCGKMIRMAGQQMGMRDAVGQAAPLRKQQGQRQQNGDGAMVLLHAGAVNSHDLIWLRPASHQSTGNICNIVAL